LQTLLTLGVAPAVGRAAVAAAGGAAQVRKVGRKVAANPGGAEACPLDRRAAELIECAGGAAG